MQAAVYVYAVSALPPMEERDALTAAVMGGGDGENGGRRSGRSRRNKGPVWGASP